MDSRFLQIAGSAEYAASIIGNPETQVYILLDTRTPAPSAASETARIMAERHMRYLGVIGIVQGVPRVALSVPLDADSIALLAHTFVQRIEADTMSATVIVDRPHQDDFVRFAEALWRLEDPRTEL